MAAGILDAATRERLVLFTRNLRRGTAGADEEQFRLLTGFNDVFAAIAIAVLLVAVATIVSLVSQLVAAVAVAALSWALAEYFTRRRRMALPSILLLLSFIGSVFAIVLGLAGASAWVGNSVATSILVGGSLAGLGAAVAHWRRFRVPITIAAGSGVASLALIGTVGGILGPAFGIVGVNLAPLLVLFCGACVFTLAMWFDSRDVARVTRRSDVAFWLHLLASPMLVHPLFASTGLADSAGRPAAAIITVLAFAVLTLLALAIDRRALIVSALGYAIFAVQALIGQGGNMPIGSSLGLLIIGLLLVFLSAAWRPARLLLLRTLPEDWRARLPMAVA